MTSSARQCCVWISEEPPTDINDHSQECGKPAIEWFEGSDGTKYPMCAEHFDQFTAKIDPAVQAEADRIAYTDDHIYCSCWNAPEPCERHKHLRG